jgi:hypothetical protein
MPVLQTDILNADGTVRIRKGSFVPREKGVTLPGEPAQGFTPADFVPGVVDGPKVPTRKAKADPAPAPKEIETQ